MNKMKARFFALIIILVFAGLTYYNWHQLQIDGRYSLKLATFGPVGVVGGFFLLLFPSHIGKPTTTKDKIMVLVIFVLGLVAGLLNLYLMDPGMFSFGK